MSQAKQPTSTPTVPVSTVKPAEYEKGATSSTGAGSAAKPGATSVPAATTAAGTVPTSSAATVSAGVPTGAKVSGGLSTGAPVSGAPPTGPTSTLGVQSGSSKVTPQTSPISSANAPPVSAGSGAVVGTGGAGARAGFCGVGKPTTEPVKPKDAPPVSAGSGAVVGTGGVGGAGKPTTDPVKPKDAPPVSAAGGTGGAGATVGVGGAGKPTTDPVKPKDAPKDKAQVQVCPPATKTSAPASAVDPLDALAGTLPSSEPLVPKAPQFTGPKVKEPGLTSEKAHRCGEDERTLPPGYRLEDMEKKVPAGVPDKPKEVPKSLTEDEALASLSAGFLSSAVPSAPKSTPSTAKAPPGGAGSGAVVGTGGVPGAGKPATDPIKVKCAAPVSTVDGTAAAGGVGGAGKPTTDPVKPKDAQPVSAVGGTGGAGATVGVGGAGKPTTDPIMAKDAPKDKAQSTVASSSKPEPEPLKMTGVTKPSATANVLGSTTQKDDTKAKEAKVQMDVSAPAAKASAPVQAGPPEKPTEASKRSEVSAPSSLSPAPPADKKAKVEKPAKECVKPALAPEKPKPDEGDLMSLDALSALGDTLAVDKPAPEPPKLRPEDIVDEKQAKAEKGVRVGERDDTLPPEYRFSEDNQKDRPALPKEPSLDPAEALDILSGDFTSPSVAPAVQAPVPPSACAAKQPKVEDLSALDALAGDFATPVQSKKVSSVAPPAPKTTVKSTPGLVSDEADPMSLDALSELGDMLPTAKPVPESPQLRPADIVDEEKLKSQKGVLVGERDDTLPPDYRFSEEDLKKYPAPPREPSLDPDDALDILSGDFTSPSEAPAVQAPLASSAPLPDSSADFDLEELSHDFVAPVAVSKVHSAVTGPPKTDRQLSESTASAMDALSDTLMDMRPAPQPAPISPKDIIKEKQAVEEKVTKPGERDDSLPPEYRPTEADIKAAAEAKAKAKADISPKQKALDESTAIDVLSGDFSTPAPAPPAVPVASSPSQKQTAPTKTPPTVSAPKAQGPVLDKPGTTPVTKPKDSKAKKPAADDLQATDDLSGQPSTDVVSTSPQKKGGKS